jgi:hypothetical protein
MRAETPAPLSRPPADGAPGARGLASAAASLADWALLLPLALAHEATHAVAAALVGARPFAAGVSYEDLGAVAGLTVPRLRGFFVLHEPAGSEAADALVAFSPLLWLPLCTALWLQGAHWAPVAYSALVGASGLRDLVVAVAGLEAPACRHAFVVGGPAQRQATLGWYA